MKRTIIIGSIFILLSVGAAAGFFYWKNLRGAGPAFAPPPQDIVDLFADQPTVVGNQIDFVLRLPDDFAISIFADNLSGARVIALDQFGNFWVSRPAAGVVTMLSVENGRVVAAQDIFRGLNQPHGLAFDPDNPTVLYIAETNAVSRVTVYSDGQLEKLVDLPTGGRHTTRSLLFGLDGKLYVSIGSSCDVCDESDSRRAAIYVMDKDGSNFTPYATGLRNAVFMTLNSQTGQIVATEMGRDQLGDNLPPDEINVIQADHNYGWPSCYGKNIHDEVLDKKVYIRAPCSEPFETPSLVDLPAHSAPLGLDFIGKSSWPAEYQGNLIVAYHGSWNRTEPTGYKLVRIIFDANGNYLETKDFITGWLTGDGALGRPVDVEFSNGALYVSDDKAGVIYKVIYSSQVVTDNADLITVFSPKPGEAVKSPLTVTGEARGYWFFEASFPVRLLDANGTVLVETFATAQDEWMTENFVPFSVELTFTQPASQSGQLILMRDNPSGLPENDASILIPIIFGGQNGVSSFDECVAAGNPVMESYPRQCRSQSGELFVEQINPDGNDCIVTGCSGQVCADHEVVTTCEFRPEYGCYGAAMCERQNNGECGWTPTVELINCLNNNALVE